MSLYVISYDITENKTRNKVSKILEGYGKRIQYSVFECEISEKLFEKLYEQLLEQTINSKTDSIRIYRLCSKCASECITIGTIKENAIRQTDDVIVI